MSARTLCGCQHAQSTHERGEGKCGRCPCEAWKPAYPVFLDALPEGVVALKDYEGSGLTLVACSHVEANGQCCPFCRAEPWMTEGHTLPVKRLVFAPKELTLL